MSVCTAGAFATEGDAATAGLLAAVVGQIVLAKGGIKKEEFWSLLNELGVRCSLCLCLCLSVSLCLCL